MGANRAWQAAQASTQAAEIALRDHKHNCPDCATPRQQMCPAGRRLLNHLWDCQRVQHEAWHARVMPTDQPALFPVLGADDDSSEEEG